MVKTMIKTNKKGWLRIVEASFAIILILSVALILYSRTIQKPQKSELMYNLEKLILEEVSSQPNLRQEILQGNSLNINSFVGQRVPAGFNFSLKTIKSSKICWRT